MSGFDGKLALVTGASRGIGAAIADELAGQGACVIGTATSASGAAAITDRLAQCRFPGQGRVLDVSDAGSVDALFKDLPGAPLILVNNAGITRDTLLMRMKPDDWDAVIQTNLSGIYRTCRAAMRGMMKAREGRIINIASVVGVMGNAGQTNYAAAKAGIIGFSKSLAREVGSRSITVNVIAPGFIQTDMTDALDAGQREALTSQIPLERLGGARDIALATCFLAGEGGAYITGETLNVNGGLNMA